MLKDLIKRPEQSDDDPDQGFVFEALEPRVLLSADLAGVLAQAVLAEEQASAAAAEELVIHEHEKTLLTSPLDSTSETQSDSILRHEIAFVDTGAKDYQLLVDDLLTNQHDDKKIEVILLDSNRNGIEQITEALSEYQNIDAVHIISHGSNGNIQLGNTRLNAGTLTENNLAIALWSESFAESGDILFYGCNLAATENGQSLMESLSLLTNTDIAASDDLTGQAELGGDWELEYTVGTIDTDVAISTDLQASYQGVLGVPPIAHWTFDTDTTDSSGNNYDGALPLPNDATIDTTSATNKVDGGKLSLDGTDDQVDLSAHIASLSTLTEGSISAWFNTTDAGFNPIFSVTDSNSPDDYAYLEMQSGRLLFEVRSGGATADYTMQYGTPLNDGNWHHVSITVDSGGNHFYVDGVEILAGGGLTYAPGSTANTQFFDDVNNVNTISIGAFASSFSSTGRFTGLLDDVQIHDYALTSDQVALLATVNDAPSFHTPSFTAHTITTGADGVTSATMADVDGDGDMDMLSASQNDDKIAWYENDGNENFIEHVISTGADVAQSVATADVDGDGDMDVLSASFTDDKIAWYENDGSENFIEHVITTGADGATSVTTADVDGDGDMDVLSASFKDNKITWYENDGSENFTERVITTGANGVQSVTTADVDGDGDMDVLSASLNDNKIAWYENDGSESFTEHVVTTATNGARSVTTADVDGDGDMDVLSASHYDDKISWYENDGSESFTQRIITTSADGARSVTTIDMDGDGDMDVLSTSLNDDKIAWYENDGSQNFTEHVITTGANSARSVTTADVDGDGDVDVLSASSSDKKIAWYENVATALDGNPTFIEDGAAVVLDADVDLSDSELDALNGGLGDYNGASLTLARNGSASTEDILSFNDSNGITLVGANLIKNSQTIATFDITTTPGQLVITFTNTNGETPTSTDVDNILRQITYANSSDTPPASAQIDWTFNDGNTGAQGSGSALEATGSTTVSITAVNDAPISLADPSVYNASILGLNPLNYWRLGESAGVTAIDQGSGGNNATYTNGVTLGAAGSLAGDADTAADFDGVNQYVDAGNINVAGTGITLAAWINIDDFDNPDQRIISKANGTLEADHTWMLSTIQVGGEYHLRFRLEAGGTAQTLTAPVGALTTGQWHHTVATYDVATGRMFLFLDGERVADVYHSVGGTVGSNAQNVFIGANPNDNSRAFDGRIDEVAIFEEAITGSKIESLYFEGRGAYVTKENTPLTVSNVYGVLANDTDVEGDPLTAVFVTGPANASAFSLGLDGSFTYTPTAGFSGTDSFTYRANDGTSDSAITTVTIIVDAVNDAPIVTTTVANLTYAEEDPAIAIDSGLTISDQDSATLSLATVRITNNFSANDDLLAFADQLGITGAYNADTGVLTLSGVSSLANYQTALRSVTYQNTTSSLQREITFMVNDGTASSLPATRLIDVSATNDAPAITKDVIFTDSGQTLGSSTSLGVDIGDIDGDGDLDMVVANYSGQANKIFLNDGSGNYSDSGQNLGNSNSTSITLGDIDGDGDLDMVVGNFTGFISRVYTNDGSGTFTDDGLGLGHGNTNSVELGDIDDDGDLDIVLGNFGEGNKILTNNGSGTFTDSGQSLGTENTRSIVLGDIDGDGDLDMISGDQSLPNKVYLNDGSGDFTASVPTNAGTATNTYAVTLGDVDSDGDLDLIEANFGSPNKVLTNDGSGNFVDSGQSLGNDSTTSLDVGDLDGDGDLDIVFGNHEGPNSIYINDGFGNYSGQNLGNADSSAIHLADVNADGDLDIIVGNNTGNANKIFFNDSTISSLSTLALNEGDPAQTLTSVAIVGDIDSSDFNGGNLTINYSVAGDSGDQLSVRNQGSGAGQIGFDGSNVSFGGTNIGILNLANNGVNGNSITIDLNSNATRDAVKTLLNNITFQNTSDNPAASRTLFITVQDGDGGTSNAVTQQVIITAANDAPINSTPGTQTVIEETQTAITGISVTDVDAGASNISMQLAVFNGVLDVTLSGSATISAGSNSSASLKISGNITDLNATLTTLLYTGNQNIAGINADTLTLLTSDEGNTGSGGALTDSDSIQIDITNVNDAPTITKNALFADSGQSLGGSLSTGITTGDLDGDGDIDLVESIHGGGNHIYLNDGSGNYAFSSQILNGAQSISTTLGDVDNDGDLDIVTGNLNDTNKVYLNDGAGSFTDSGQSLGNSLTYAITLGDIDNDGDLDMVVGNHSGQADKVYINDGAGNFTDSTQSLGTDETTSIILGDIDNDGDLDLISGIDSSPNKVYLNNGSGDFTISAPGNVGTTTLTTAIALGDIDGDGDLDLIEANDISPNKVFINDGSGSFTDSGQTLGNARSSSLELGDIDNDGDLDLVIGTLFSGGDKVYTNNGTGTFTDSGLSLGSLHTRGISLADTNNDGDLDIIAVNGGATNNANKIYTNQSVISSFTPLSLTEGDPAQTITSTAIVGDIDSTDLYGGTLTISYTITGDAGDQLSVRDQGIGAGQIGFDGTNITYEGSIIGTIQPSPLNGINGNTFSVSLTSNATPIATTALLNNITFQNTSGNPAASRTLNITVQDGDGGTSAAITQVVNIASVNNAPINNIPGVQAVNEDANLVFNSANSNLISITDVDAGSTHRITLTSTNGLVSLTPTAGLTFTVGDGFADTTMTFEGSLADINMALDGLSFIGDQDFNGTANIQITADDLTLITLNEDVSQKGYYTFNNSSDLGNDDSIGGSNDGTVNGAVTSNDATRGNVLSFDGNDDIQIPGLFGSPTEVTLAGWINLDSGFSDGYVISLGDSVGIVADEGGNGVSGFFYDGSSWNSTPSNQSIAGTGWHHVAYTFSDGGNVQTLYIDGIEMGATNFTNSPSYSQGTDSYIGRHGNAASGYFHGKIDEARIYDRALTASEIQTIVEGQVTTDTDNITITVNTVNDAPLLATNTGITLTEGSTGTIITTAMLNEGDPDDNGAGLTYTVTTIPANGTLRLSGTALINGSTFTQDDIDNNRVTYDHDGSETISDSLVFDLADGGENGATALTGQAFSITITPANDAPIFTGVSSGVGVPENAIVHPFETGPSIVDADNLDFDNGVLTIRSGTPGLATDQLSLLQQDGLTLSGNNVLNNGVTIGTWVGGANGADLTVTFNANAYHADVNLVFSHIEYVSTHQNPTSSPAISATISDGDGGSSGNLNGSVILVAVNDAPDGSDSTITINEGTTLTLAQGHFGFSDVENHFLKAVWITSLPANGVLQLNGTNVNSGDSISASDIDSNLLTYTPAANANGNNYASFTFEVQDTGFTAFGGIDRDQSANTITFDVTPVNDNAPVFTSPTTANVAENTTAVHQVTVTDSDLPGDTITYSISGSGADDARFSIDGSGNLSFNTAPDFETPTDANIDNDYIVDVQVFDGVNTTTQTITVTVFNGNEMPTTSGLANITVNEDTVSSVKNLFAAFDDIEDLDPALTYTISNNTNPGLFSSTVINGVAGSLTLNYAPDQNGAADITVRATDTGGFFVETTFTVTVNPVNDAPIANNETATVSEGSNVNINLAVNDTDIDNALDLTSITIVSGPVNGSLVDYGDGTVSYLHDGSQTLTDSFAYTINDVSGATSNIATVNLTITPVNNAPGQTIPPDQSININNDLVFSSANGNLISINDADAGSSPLQVTLSVADGVLTLASTSNLSFSNGGGAADQTMTFTGTLTDINIAIDGLTFRADTGFTGSTNLQITVNDLGSGGGTPQTSTNSVAIAIIPDGIIDPQPEIPDPPTPDPETPVTPDPDIEDPDEDDPTQDPVPDDEEIRKTRPDIPDDNSPDPVSDPQPEIENTEPVFDIQPELIEDEVISDNKDSKGGDLAKNSTSKTSDASSKNNGIKLQTKLEAPEKQNFSIDPGLLHELDKIDKEISEQAAQQSKEELIIKRSAEVGSVVLFVGFVKWLLQASSLFASLLGTLPAWRWVDPIPVLKKADDDKEKKQLKKSGDLTKTIIAMLKKFSSSRSMDAKKQENR